jgi:hypothetical protein
VSPLSAEERAAAAEVNAIAYLPCEHCGKRKFTALREPTKGETIRLCTKCGIHLPRAGAQR